MSRKIISAILLVLLGTVMVTGHNISPIQPVPQTAFRAIEIPNISQSPIIIDPANHITHVKPSLLLIKVAAKVEPKATPKPKAPTPIRSIKTSHSTTGVASWYCRTGVSRCTSGHSGGMYAAIRRDMLFLRGRTVKITSGGKSIYVKIVDCNCGHGANLIDLYSDAFKRLAPLSQGAMRVTVSW